MYVCMYALTHTHARIIQRSADCAADAMINDYALAASISNCI